MMHKQIFVLLVEDDDALRQTVSRTLKAAGYMVFEAASFAQATKQMAIKPDLMILDINLPDATGWEAAGWLEQFTSPVPIIVTSGVEPEPKRIEQFKPKAFLPKPFAMRELLDLIRQYAPTAHGPL